MTAAPAVRYLPDLAEQHYDELQYLWSRRRSALRSPLYRERELLMLEERIEAHAQGMIVIGDHLADFVEPGLAGDEDLPAFAAAFALLRAGTAAGVGRVFDAFKTAAIPKLGGLRDAIAHSPSTELSARLAALIPAAPLPISAFAAEAMALRAHVGPAARDVERFLLADEPVARAAGLRIAMYCAISLPTEWYARALADDDPAVQRAGLAAAAWGGSPTFPSYSRSRALQPSPEAIDALSLLAAVTPPEDYQLIGAIAADAGAGPDRFRVVGSFAHPYFIDLLIKEMENPDPASAAAAGAAFFKMTGRDVESNRRVKVSPDGKPPADDFEAEFQDEVFLPDPELARKHWQELAPTLARSPRICRGMDVSQTLSREQLAALDRESLWEYCLRMRLFSGWQGTPLVLERYPQRF